MNNDTTLPIEANQDQHIETDLLEDYVEGLVPPKDVARIKAHLGSCAQCSAVAQGIRLLRQEKGEQAEAYLDEVEERMNEQTEEKIPKEPRSDENDPGKPKPWTERTWGSLTSSHLRIAASIALPLVAIIAVIVLFLQPSEADKLVQGYLAESYILPDDFRSGSSSSVEEWEQAIEQYDDGDYEGALATLEPRDVAGKEIERQFLLGLIYLKKERPDIQKAIQAMQWVTDANSTYFEEARWYLALAYYEAEEISLCKEVLIKIEKDQYQDREAGELLEVLE